MNSALETQSREAVSKLRLPPVLFDYRLSWAKSYSDLFSGAVSKPVGVDSVLEYAERGGRALICGRAGSGKSVLARFIAKRASSVGDVVIFVDLAKWTPSDSHMFEAATADSTLSMNFVLQRFAGFDVSLLKLDSLSPAVRKLIILDGLNEVPAHCGNSVLSALDDTVTRIIGSRVIATDRLTRRQIREDRWKLGRVEPLEGDAIDKALRASRRPFSRRSKAVSHHLLDWPFFLASSLNGGQAIVSGTGAIMQFFIDRVELSAAELAAVSAAAYGTYSESSTRTFNVEEFKGRLSGQTYDKLVHAGALGVVGDKGQFVHHLHHDFLAAFHLAADRCLWNYVGFNTLSFQGSSFDSIALAFAQVSAEDKAEFVRKVYDWNPYAIAFALAEDEYRQPGDIDADIERVVLAMLAEKRWDPIIPTAVRAHDALGLFPRPKSHPFIEVQSLEALLTVVDKFQGSVPWFNEWKEIFCMRPDARLEDQTVSKLRDVDSIIGWTLANVLKRLRLDRHKLSLVVGICRDERAVVRWRAIHVLGAFPGEESIAAGFERLDDEQEDLLVRYGAIRSLIEMASKSSEYMRRGILVSVGDRRETVTKRPKLREEMVRALKINPTQAPPDWLIGTLGLLATFLEGSTTVDEIDNWSRAIREQNMLNYNQ